MSVGAEARHICRRQLDHARELIHREAAALDALSARLNDQVCVLADHILSSPGTVVVWPLESIPVLSPDTTLARISPAAVAGS
jgi:hypothetical protein